MSQQICPACKRWIEIPAELNYGEAVICPCGLVSTLVHECVYDDEKQEEYCYEYLELVGTPGLTA